jgi:predicted dehydrogenase
VFICTPVAARAALAMRALEAGTSVFVEHPIALDFDVVARVVAEAERSGTPLLCSFPIVHQPVFARALADVAAGSLGPIRRAHASLYVSRIFSAGEAERMTHGQAGGVLAHVALDALFLVTRMLGMPTECEARAMRLYDAHEDELHARMRLASGTEISLDCSWSVPGYPRPGTVLEIEGERGHLLVSDDGVEIDLAGRPHQRLVDADLPQPARFDLEGESRWVEDSAFVNWVLGGPPPPGAAREALGIHALMNAIQASVRADGKPAPVIAGAAT